MIEMHVCHAGDVIEGAPPPRPSIFDRIDLREECLGIWSTTRFCMSFPRWVRKLRDAEVLLYYATEVTSGKRKTPMDVAAMIAEWKALILTLCTAHEKDEIDKAEFRMDELLSPMLKAPVAQLREFYAGLLKALQEDKQVPFFIWSIFKGWGEMVLEKASDTSPPKALKKKLAKQVAALAAPHIKRDMVEALVGALMWRSPEALKEIKADMEAGAKPRVKGRESCIFLTTQRKGHPERQVML